MRRVESIGELLSEHLAFPGKTVVDVGCGTGELVRWLVGQGTKVTGVDTPAMLARAQAEPCVGDERYLPGGGEALPLPDGHADVVIYAASLHHVAAEQLRDAIAECARVLRPGGQVAFVEPVAEPGSYYDITRLTRDEAEIQRLAYASILDLVFELGRIFKRVNLMSQRPAGLPSGIRVSRPAMLAAEVRQGLFVIDHVRLRISWRPQREKMSAA